MPEDLVIFFFDARKAEYGVKQAAPGNVSTHDRFIDASNVDASNGSRRPEQHDGTKHRVR